MQKRIISGFILLSIIFLYISHAAGQTYTSQQSLNWQIITNSQNKKINASYFLGFAGAAYQSAHPATPVFFTRIPIALAGKVTATLQDEVYIPETDPVIAGLLDYLPEHIDISTVSEELQHQPVVSVNFVPIRKNPATGQLEKLAGFTLSVTIDPFVVSPAPSFSANKKGTDHSFLSTGYWYKIGVSQTGVYKLDYNFMRSLGFADNCDLTQVKIYGRPGGMLPQQNNIPRDNDLVQNAIQVVSATNKLDAASYIIFYAKGPTSWAFDTASHHFHHQVNYYSDVSYYFITNNGAWDDPAKRIQNKTATGTPTHEISTFDAYDYHELDTVTSITTSVKSGREWFGEDFNAINKPTLEHTINFDFPQADPAKQMYMRTSTAARSYPGNSSFDFSLDGGNSYILNNEVEHDTDYDDFTNEYAKTNDASKNILNTMKHYSVMVKFNPGAPEALGWLNYIEFNVPSLLNYAPGQFGFRTASSVGANVINRYHISGAPANFQVWDVTDFHNIANVSLTSGANEKTFQANGDVLRDFVAIDGFNYYTPKAIGRMEPQDIRGLPQPDMVIVTHPDFKAAADDLAAYHREHDNLVVSVVTPDQVYNEFSSGTQDISAIRDMMKMFYNRDSVTGKNVKFLLLMGAASYDYKDRVKNHTNFVPTYEGALSTYAANSYCSDDYYTLLAKGEGNWNDYTNEICQISVGRITVYTAQQAQDVVNKTKRYADSKCMHDWRNKVVMVGDDREGNGFVEDAQNFCDNIMGGQHPVLNIKKLYLDATPELNTPAGQLFPEINAAIDENVNNGCLVMNFIGHGGQQGWAHEKVLTIPSIRSWNNPYNMPLIITATCQFSTFDDPDNISAGEYALMNPNGGPFALLTTTREVDIGGNGQLNNAMLNKNLFEKINGKPKCIGEVFMDAKNKVQLTNSRNFALLGDPAVRLALPQYDVKVTSISRHGASSDSFKALSLMTITGEISDSGKRISDFNGDIYPTVFDKVAIKHTLGQAQNDPNDSDSPLGFKTQDNIIYKGHATVTNGTFTFQFVVPKDITFDKGAGKLSFYASNGVIDANGYSDSIIVGGSDDNAIITHQPPRVKLFMNDTNFIAGGIVNDNPSLVARVYSELGINTLGSIGHNLEATLTKTSDPGESDNTVVLNNFYNADKDSYQSGTITYPFKSLSDGHYNLNIKVWDVADNSAMATTDFLVINSSKLTIDKIFNYPNPFNDETTFQFEHNRPNETLHVDIAIFDMGGRLIRDLQSDLTSAGDRQTAIHWNGTQAGGGKISSGLYVYQLTVKTSDGQIAEKSSKMIVIK